MRLITPIKIQASRWLFDDTKPANRLFKWGFLALLLGLIFFHIWWRVTLPPKYPHDKTLGLIGPSMMLMNHIAFVFRWQNLRTRATLRSTSFALTVAGCIYVFWAIYAGA